MRDAIEIFWNINIPFCFIFWVKNLAIKEFQIYPSGHVRIKPFLTCHCLFCYGLLKGICCYNPHEWDTISMLLGNFQGQLNILKMELSKGLSAKLNLLIDSFCWWRRRRSWGRKFGFYKFEEEMSSTSMIKPLSTSKVVWIHNVALLSCTLISGWETLWPVSFP